MCASMRCRGVFRPVAAEGRVYAAEVPPPSSSSLTQALALPLREVVQRFGQRAVVVHAAVRDDLKPTQQAAGCLGLAVC